MRNAIVIEVTTRGHKANDSPITDEMVEEMADEAERGYEVDEILRRRRGGRDPA